MSSDSRQQTHPQLQSFKPLDTSVHGFNKRPVSRAIHASNIAWLIACCMESLSSMASTCTKAKKGVSLFSNAVYRNIFTAMAVNRSHFPRIKDTTTRVGTFEFVTAHRSTRSVSDRCLHSYLPSVTPSPVPKATYSQPCYTLASA